MLLFIITLCLGFHSYPRGHLLVSWSILGQKTPNHIAIGRCIGEEEFDVVASFDNHGGLVFLYMQTKL
jgi:hypothetical protein